jgi:signal transduction histidine kinase
LRLGTPVRGEEALIERPDGSRIPVHINVDPIRDAAGRIAGAIVVFQDVTHLKRAEAALTADHRKDQFVAMLAINLLKVPIDLRTVVESAIQSIKPDVDSKGLALSVELPREFVYVDGDAARLEQAVVNLLDNAMKYTDTGGRIGVALPPTLRKRCCACRTRASAFARRCCRAFSTFSPRTKAR